MPAGTGDCSLITLCPEVADRSFEARRWGFSALPCRPVMMDRPESPTMPGQRRTVHHRNAHIHGCHQRALPTRPHASGFRVQFLNHQAPFAGGLLEVFTSTLPLG
jgi:hypothetical protein